MTERQAQGVTTDRDGATPERLLDILAELRDALRAAPFGLAVRDLDRTIELATRTADQLEDYLIPRLAAPGGPLLVVFGGSTGAGKSTLLNSLVGEAVSRAGVLRPTTRSAVLVCHPDDAQAFDGRGLLPAIPRDTEDRPGTVRVVVTDTVPAGLAFIDTPDVDSVVADNRDIAARLIAAADIWAFVTTASRYADDLPWMLLRRAAARDASVAVVLSRADGTNSATIRDHLAELLRAENLGAAPLFVVPRSELVDGLLPSVVVEPIRTWAAGLAAAPADRATLVDRTVNGALGAVPAMADEVADALAVQRDAVATLRAELETVFSAASEQLRTSVEEGSLFRGEVLGHWQNFAGHGGLIALLEARAGTVSPILRGAQGLRAARVRAGLVLGAVRLFTAVVDRAGADTAAAWRRHPYGEAVIDEAPEPLDGVSADTTTLAETAAQNWLAAVDTLIGRPDGSVYADAIPVIVRATLEDGTLPTGRAIDVGGGTVSLSQDLLADVFDDESVVTAAGNARADLIDRLQAALTMEEARFISRLDSLEPTPEEVDDLRNGATALRRALATDLPADDHTPVADPDPTEQGSELTDANEPAVDPGPALDPVPARVPIEPAPPTWLASVPTDAWATPDVTPGRPAPAPAEQDPARADTGATPEEPKDRPTTAAAPERGAGEGMDKGPHPVRKNGSKGSIGQIGAVEVGARPWEEL
jgi:energy-coupling factor transporter ATP-binding protein EcfA2